MSTPLILREFDDVHAALTSEDLTRSIDRDIFETGNILEQSVLVLHGQAHRDRRRVENRAFRQSLLIENERTIFPAIIERRFDRIVGDDGEADLVRLGGLLTLEVAARTAGIDFDGESVQECEELLAYLRLISKGSALESATGDIDEIRESVRTALLALNERFLIKSMERRLEAIKQTQPGDVDEDNLPKDILTMLLLHRSQLGMSLDDVLRETAFFLDAGSFTTSQTFTSTLHFLFSWRERNAEAYERLHLDRLMVQRCVHEGLRVRPTNPGIKRRALRRTKIGSTIIEEEALVSLDTLSANRDARAYGEDADDFNPLREPPPTISRYGHSFGGGIHACIGRVLAVGLPIRDAAEPPDDHLYGIATLMVQHALARGVEPDVSNPPAAEAGTERWTRWGTYPAIFRR